MSENTAPPSLSAAGLDFIKNREGLRLTAYPDPGTNAEPYTIGYGHTGGVKADEECTMDQATAWLLADCQKGLDTLATLVKVPLMQGEIDALTDFIFNEGVGNFSRSTLLTLLNQGDYDGAANEFAKWDLAAGRVLPGLVARRTGEKDEFLA